MRQSLVIANWKLNGDLNLVNQMIDTLSAEAFSAEVVLCPPAPYLYALSTKSKSTKGLNQIKVGAQNCSEFNAGAYTGEIAADMLVDTGCQYVLIGHSERRTLFAESEAAIANKVRNAQQAGLKVVLCIGETLEQRENDQTIEVVKAQLSNVFEDVDFTQLVIAYEPVWAIGTGKTASPEQVQQVHAQIRSMLEQVSPEWGPSIPLLYGGSVKAENAEVLFAQADIDGGLIGGASLKADQFRAICSAVKG